MLEGITVNLYRSIIPAGRSLLWCLMCVVALVAQPHVLLSLLSATMNSPPRPPFFQEVELAAYFGLCSVAANREVKNKYEDRSRSSIELLQLYSGASTFRTVGCESDQR